MTDQHCHFTEEANVPITGITVPFCGFGVNIDASKLPKCKCGLTRDEVQAMIEQAVQAAKEETQTIIEASRYTLCEFYFLRNPALRPGFELAQGALLENAATLYPEAWAYLQTAEGRALCVTEEEWQAMTHATWATLADGTHIGWDGIGGAPFYAPDLETGALRLPDIRGMYMEAAGFDGLDVGTVHGDGVREMPGALRFIIPTSNSGNGMILQADGSGAFVSGSPSARSIFSTSGGTTIALDTTANLEIDRVVPVAAKNQPRAFGVLPCVYLGAPK